MLRYATIALLFALASAGSAFASTSPTALPDEANVASAASDLVAPVTLARRGADDGPNHDVGDDHGGRRGGKGRRGRGRA